MEATIYISSGVDCVVQTNEELLELIKLEMIIPEYVKFGDVRESYSGDILTIIGKYTNVEINMNYISELIDLIKLINKKYDAFKSRGFVYDKRKSRINIKAAFVTGDIMKVTLTPGFRKYLIDTYGDPTVVSYNKIHAPTYYAWTGENTIARIEDNNIISHGKFISVLTRIAKKWLAKQ